ncbi:MAG TPA: hypothetical protein VN108_06395 [Marmoricola sp.]|nr:hypothetical protein [Marmoricola sp.]
MTQDNTLDESGTTQDSGIQRRTLVKGAAWSLPVIALATAVPAHAASIVTAKYDVGISVANCNALQIGGAPQFVIQNFGPESVPAGKQVRITFSGLPGISLNDFALSGFAGSAILAGSTLTATLPELAPGGKATITPGGALVGVQAATFMSAQLLDNKDSNSANDAIAYGYFGVQILGGGLGFCQSLTTSDADLLRAPVPWDLQIDAVCATGAFVGWPINEVTGSAELSFRVKNVSDVTVPAGEKVFLKGTGVIGANYWQIEGGGSGGGIAGTIVGLQSPGLEFTLPEMPPGKEVKIATYNMAGGGSQFVLYYPATDAKGINNFGANSVGLGAQVLGYGILICAGSQDGVA